MTYKVHNQEAAYIKQQRLLNLRAMRHEELNRILSYFPPESHILELGAGAGWQSLTLQQKGHHVHAVDLIENSYRINAVFPIIPYDGYNLPFDSGSFDIIFSSNVLEHIQHLDLFEEEILRVLKPDGLAIHILPTGSWRFWTSITHPAWVLRRLIELLYQYSASSELQHTSNIPSNAHWYHAIWPNRHGEKGNSLTELYHFSRYAWRKHFKIHDWHLQKVEPLGIFYTGGQILHKHLKMGLRCKLAKLFGSSTCVYVCRR